MAPKPSPSPGISSFASVTHSQTPFSRISITLLPCRQWRTVHILIMCTSPFLFKLKLNYLLWHDCRFSYSCKREYRGMLCTLTHFSQWWHLTELKSSITARVLTWIQSRHRTFPSPQRSFMLPFDSHTPFPSLTHLFFNSWQPTYLFSPNWL